MEVSKPSRRIVNLFGAFGYTLLIFSITVTVGVVMMWLIQGGHFQSEPLPEEIVSDGAPVESDDQSGGVLLTILAYGITAFMFLAVIFILITLPYWLGKTGSYILRKVIRFFRWRVTWFSLLISKIIISFLAVVPMLTLTAGDTSLLSVLFFVSILSVLALASFLMQHHLARVNELSVEDIW